MAEQEMPNVPQHVRYGNSDKSRGVPIEAPEEPATRVAAPVAQAKETEGKKTLGMKFRDSFTGADGRSLMQTLWQDLAVPSIKELAFNALTEGARQTLFGFTGGPARPVGGSAIGSRGYHKIYGQAATATPAAREVASRGPVPTAEYATLLFEDRGSAEVVLDALVALIDEYGSATVADYYSLSGRSADYTATAIGWKSLGGARPKYTNEGYILDLPRAVPLS